MRKNYVFSEPDRVGLAGAFVFMLFRLVIFVPSYFMAKESGLDITVIRIIWGIAAFILLFVPLFRELKHFRTSSARYEFTDDSVSVRIWRTVRSVKAYDPVHIAVKTFIFKNMNTRIERQYYILWKHGAAIPEDFSRPFRTISKYEIIALPHNEEVRKKLCSLFGAREELTRDIASGKDMGYVLPTDEIGMYYYSDSIVLPFIFTWSVMFFTSCEPGRLISNMVQGILLSFPCVLLLVLRFGMIKEKYIFARYWFSDNAVHMLLGNDERVIRSSDTFQISLRAACATRFRKAGELKFIVLWRDGEPEPEDNIYEIKLMKRYNAIVLPDTEDVRLQLQKRLGVKVIGYWRTWSRAESYEITGPVPNDTKGSKHGF